MQGLNEYATMLSLTNISFKYNPEIPVVQNISFEIPQGTHVSILGESGCGKSTLLKLIYGLYDVEKGTIFWKNNQVLGPSYNLVPGHEKMKYLAQDFGLMPYTTAAENIGTYLSNFYPEEKQQRIQELLEMVEMTAFANVKPKFLSGGQQQRIALAKVLAREPELLLLDEPFSQIDNFRKNTLRRNLFSYLKAKNITCIVATHDSTDALSFSDKTIILKQGKLIAQDTPQQLYNHPKNRYVASLFGEINALPASVLSQSNTSEETVLVYPHQLKLDISSNFRIIIKDCYFKGNHYLISAMYEDIPVFFNHSTILEIGSEVGLKVMK